MPSIGNSSLGRTYKRQLNKRLKITKLVALSKSFIPTNYNINNPGEIKVNSYTNADTGNSAEVSHIRCSFASNSSYNTSSVEDKPSQEVENSEDLVSLHFPCAIDTNNIKQNIRLWAVENNIKSNAVNSLLGILQRHSCFSELPSDSRALLKTPREIKITEISPGKYCHFPLVDTLLKVIKDYEGTSVGLQLNVDGLPISKSSNQQFWPILAHVTDLPNSSPFVLGIYFGNDKPKSSNDFLQLAVQDLLEVSESGVIVNKTPVAV